MKTLTKATKAKEILEAFEFLGLNTENILLYKEQLGGQDALHTHLGNVLAGEAQLVELKNQSIYFI